VQTVSEAVESGMDPADIEAALASASGTGDEEDAVPEEATDADAAPAVEEEKQAEGLVDYVGQLLSRKMGATGAVTTTTGGSTPLGSSNTTEPSNYAPNMSTLPDMHPTRHIPMGEGGIKQNYVPNPNPGTTDGAAPTLTKVQLALILAGVGVAGVGGAMLMNKKAESRKSLTDTLAGILNKTAMAEEEVPAIEEEPVDDPEVAPEAPVDDPEGLAAAVADLSDEDVAEVQELAEAIKSNPELATELQGLVSDGPAGEEGAPVDDPEGLAAAVADLSDEDVAEVQELAEAIKQNPELATELQGLV
jgi:NTP pyrophosphatase (non-canonical NTP hydrolase)